MKKVVIFGKTLLIFSLITICNLKGLAQQFPTEGIPITLSNIDNISITTQFPTHATIPFPKGMLHLNQINNLKLCTTAHPNVAIPIQAEIIASWPERSNPSIKWLHVFFNSSINNGRAEEYILKLIQDIAMNTNLDTLVVRGSGNRNLRAGDRLMQDETLIIKNNHLEFAIEQDFKGVSSLSIEGSLIINASSHTDSGPFLSIGEESYYPNNNSIVTVESIGKNLIVIRAEGSFNNSKHKYTTRIYAYANSSNIRIQHAITFTEDMRQSNISSMGFNINRFDNPNRPSKVHIGFEDQAYHEENLGINNSMFLHQESEKTSRIIRGDEILSQPKASGWVYISRSGTQSIGLVVRDFWQKYPNEIGVEPGKIGLYFWPEHGRDDVFSSETQLSQENVYKFLCFHQGQNLNLSIPDIYKTSPLSIYAEKENAQGNAESSTAQGISIFNEFDLVFGQAVQAMPILKRLLDARPIALPNPKWVAESKVFGEVSEKVSGFDDIENAIIDAPLNYCDPERGKNYGKFNFGDTNHGWDLEHNSPQLHRAWFNNHYHFGTSLWQTFILRNDPNDNRLSLIFNRIRSLTDHYSSIDQCRFNTESNYIGAFWHGKSWVHWAGDLSTYKHWVDPSCLLLAWYIDDNRWAKDGYQLYANNLNHYTSTASAIENTSFYSRDLVTDIYNASTLVQSRPDPLLLSQIDSIARLLLVPTLETLPFCAESNYYKAFCDDNDPFWQPLWLNKYLEVQKDPTITQKLIPYITQNSTHDLLITSTSLAFSAEAYRLTGNVHHLTRHFYFLNKYPQHLYKNASDSIYHNFGAGPWALGDNHFPLQWPYFLKQMREAGFCTIPKDREEGYYPYLSSFNIFVLKTKKTPYIKFRYDVDQPGNPTSYNSFEYYHSKKLNLPSGEHTTVNANYTTTLRDASLRRIGRFETSYTPTSTDSLLVVYGVNTNQALYMPINQEGFPEGIIMRSSHNNTNSDFATSCTKGYLTPLYNVPMRLTIAKGNQGIAKITVKDKNNRILVDNATIFTPIDTIPIIVDLPLDAGPFFIDIYGSYAFTNAYVKMSVSLASHSVNIAASDPIMLFTRTKEDGEILKAYGERHR